jgi:uncharacterized membrane protein
MQLAGEGNAVRVIVYIARVLCAATIVLPAVTPEIWYWQLVGGILYGMSIPFFLGLFEHKDLFLSILDRSAPMTKHKGFVFQCSVIIAVWLTIWILWPCLLVYMLNARLAIWFIVGSFIGSLFDLWIASTMSGRPD